ncbi:uncharacterized protein VP01_3702g1 [Puccinia sorghi]|uniref:Uncharacterized protein n=1 Tax=Puccinia sorghi TaxID=27349 RepID=A0A0L6UW24_9BASI|nr:uncharacterized protein VP01_3702g1 [Puccinia sorghi]
MDWLEKMLTFPFASWPAWHNVCCLQLIKKLMSARPSWKIQLQPRTNTNMSLKRPRTSSPSLTPNHHHAVLDQENSHTSIRNLQAWEAELCELDRLGLQAESRSDQLEGGRLIRLNTLITTHQQPDASDMNSVWVDR